MFRNEPTALPPEQTAQALTNRNRLSEDRSVPVIMAGP
jgi:hypothetical protein